MRKSRMVRHLIRHTTYATMDGRTWFKGIIILSINNSMTFTLRITDINQSDLRAYFIDKDLSAFYVIGVTERGTNGEDHYHCVIQLHGYKLNSLIKDLKRKGIISTGNKSYATKELKETDITSYSQSVSTLAKMDFLHLIILHIHRIGLQIIRIYILKENEG